MADVWAKKRARGQVGGQKRHEKGANGLKMGKRVRNGHEKGANVPEKG